ncbi:MAG: FumA C-terminus/TtdB family hydratase beta subunit [Ignisphaera sp.]
MANIYRISSPFHEELDFLKVGDIVYLSGIVVTARDQVHKRIVLEGLYPPIQINRLAVWHAGPTVKRKDNEWIVISIGSTSSSRMESIEAEFIEKTGVKMIIGKGFMGKKTVEACRRYGCVVAIYPGGLGALGAKAVRKVIDVYWLDLGIPEAMWVLVVENLGPLIISIDTHGNTITDTSV